MGREHFARRFVLTDTFTLLSFVESFLAGATAGLG